MKMKNIQAYPIDGVPDHVVQECGDLGILMMLELLPIINKKHPNLVLGAIAFVHASMIKNAVSDDPEEQRKAAEMAAFALIKNVVFLNDLPKDAG